ncbi:cyclopropane fatty acyl phospholipid synthase [Pirellula sp. SH-Sr6A]|uniref:class I SAM-dependent methyltransferase n=1 Tax=Pirellula sp. SH-Sr6A TaxID=1632865 RepID=UPI00078D37C0|nr:class I SAM-dependent methyltransferase [Pirellula sp. SH-Sr6A]AMV31838.1 cyclopropane fatty acyl phospholipid synthase [Pirellula sp. SH-Sr6A]
MNPEYIDYREWKGWGRENALSGANARYFEKEIFRDLTRKPNSLLEIGFGNGEFLEWAKTQNLNITGLEIIPELVTAAVSKGFEAFHSNIASESEDNSLAGRKFDCIVAFDVIEHLSTEEIRHFLKKVRDLLSDDGRVILRFPNGESPFSIPLLNGDHTHRSWLCRAKLEHLCINSGLAIQTYRNASRVANESRYRYAKRLFFLLRDLIEIILGYTYYSKRLPLDPNAVAILRKQNPTV